MRAYLLGLLSPEETAELEEQYFTQRSFFLQLQDEEVRLIHQYLDKTLSPPEMDRFALQYRSTPELRQKLEQVARERQVRVSPRRTLVWWSAAACLVLAAGGISAAYFFSRPLPQLVAGGTGSVYRLQLSPGVEKGQNQAMPTVTPSAGGILRLSLELPGVRGPVLCDAKISRVDDDGGFRTVWRNPSPVWSSPSGADQELVLTLASPLFASGDYVVEVQGSTGSTRETYLFRVLPRP